MLLHGIRMNILILLGKIQPEPATMNYMQSIGGNMNDKIDKDIAIVVICLLLIVAAYSAITTSRELGELRQSYSELEARNRQLELANSEYQQRLDSIAGRITSAQDAVGRAGDSVSKIRAIVDAIDAISQDLRKPTTVSQP